MLFDGHQVMLDEYVYQAVLQEEQLVNRGISLFKQHYLPLLKAQGVQFVHMILGGDHTVQVLYSASDTYPFWDVHKKLDLLQLEEEAGCDAFILCRSPEDMDRVLEGNRIGIIAGIEGGRPLEGKKNLNLLSSLRSLYRGGLRSIQLTGNSRNRLADGKGDERTGGGLTSFGVAVVKEARRLGMMIDTARLSDPGFYDLLGLIDGPLIDSHSCSRAVSFHELNIDDRRVKAIAETGGLVALSFLSPLLKERDAGQASGQDLLRHLDHLVDLVGIDHVALGPDYSAIRTPLRRDLLRGYANRGPNFCGFDKRTPLQSEKYPGRIGGVDYGTGESDYIAGPESHEQFLQVLEILEGGGYQGVDLEKITGRNLFRVFRDALKGGGKPIEQESLMIEQYEKNNSC